MTENLETALNWPERGLAGVPAPERLQAERAAAEAAAAAAGTQAIPMDLVGDVVSSISHSIDELATTTARFRALLDDSNGSESGDDSAWDEASVTEAKSSLGRAEQSLDRLARVVTQVSVKLDRVNRALGDRIDVSNGSTKTKVAPKAQPETGDAEGGPGHAFTLRLRPHAADPTRAAVTWPPWIPDKDKRPLWARPLIFVPVLVLALVVGGGIYKYASRTTAPTFPTSGSTLAGATCQAGTTVASIELESQAGDNGVYTIGALGGVANGATTSMKDVVVQWAVTYQDGYTTTQSSVVTGSTALAGKSAKAWSALVAHNEGTVPPLSARVISVSALPAQPACA